MTDEERGKLDFRPIEQTRPVWKYKDWFTENGKNIPVTFLVCQKNTKHLIQLCIESLIRFYPDVNILVVDDNSDDDSLLYLKFKELTTPNLKVWFRTDGYIGHGDQLHKAIVDHITTDYVLILDSDVIVDRGGWLEEMLGSFDTNSKLYVIGALQPSSYANNGDEPKDLDDVVRYCNPQFCLLHRPTYFDLVESGTDSWGKHVEAPFITDGTPLILNMKAARDAGLDVAEYPADYYVSHASGGTWMTPRNYWADDHDIKIRPFVTFIISDNCNVLSFSNDNDFDIVIAGKQVKDTVSFADYKTYEVDNKLFGIRFNVSGEYVVDLSNESEIKLQYSFVTDLKQGVNENNVPDEMEVHGIKCVRRTEWQKKYSIK
jgi:glycosyltransferase involved in cell wall biosynthesis